jgi:hypothetical protein
MENARIIRLDAPLTVSVSSFGEAFGEYSELRGRGRARRAARKADRQEKRQTKRMTRISNRAERKGARQDMRAAQQEARQTRKDTRKTRRVARQEMVAKEPQEPIEDEQQPMGDEEQGQPTQDEGAGEGEYETTQDSDIQDPEEQNTSEDEEYGFDGEYYDNFDAEMSGADGIEYENLGATNEIYALQDDDFYSFVDESSSADGFQNRTVRKRIGKGTKDVAMRSEWNKEMVSRLQAKVDAIDAEINAGTSPEREQMLGIKRAQMLEKIILHKDRAVGFDGLMNDYINAEGDYSGIDGDTSDADGDSSDADGDYENADGDYENADGEFENADGEFENADGEFENAIGKRKKRPAKRSKKMLKKAAGYIPAVAAGRAISKAVKKKKKKVGKNKRTAEVKAAVREAKKSRVKSRIASGRKKKKAVEVSLSTKVSKNLNPEFGKDYIVIPEKEIGLSSAEGTGLIALDDINDFDAPRENEYSLASGNPLKKVNWKGVLIGVAIAGLAIYGAKKAKLF